MINGYVSRGKCYIFMSRSFFFKSGKCDQPELTRMYSVVRKV